MFNFIGKIKCKFKAHTFVVLKEPSDLFDDFFAGPSIDFKNDGIRYCKYCRQLESFSYHCLGLNPPSYIPDDIKRIPYERIVKNLVENPYCLTVEDLQFIKITKPELFDYAKTYLKGDK